MALLFFQRIFSLGWFAPIRYTALMLTRLQRRLQREKKIISVMVEMYCHDVHHSSAGLCPGCGGALGYANRRIDKCRFKENKPTCSVCPVHCFRPPAKDTITTIMRYAGPRMAWRHPILSLTHFWDKFRLRSHPEL